MANRWVVNASPLILLSKAGHIDLLAKLTTKLVIPRSVADEIYAGPTADPAKQWLQTHGAELIVADATVPQGIASWDLGSGETAVLSWAQVHHGFEAILDDRAARRCAAVYTIPCRGTLGVILAARKTGFIPAARPVCDLLVQSGLLIGNTFLNDALKLVNE